MAANGTAEGRTLEERGRQAAARYLKRNGYEIIERDWECPAGGAAIIALDDGALVFFDVYTRTSLEDGLPAEKVDAEKRSRCEKIAGWYLRDHDYTDMHVRFDIVALLVLNEERALVRHYVNAFSQVA